MPCMCGSRADGRFDQSMPSSLAMATSLAFSSQPQKRSEREQARVSVSSILQHMAAPLYTHANSSGKPSRIHHMHQGRSRVCLLPSWPPWAPVLGPSVLYASQRTDQLALRLSKVAHTHPASPHKLTQSIQRSGKGRSRSSPHGIIARPKVLDHALEVRVRVDLREGALCLCS